MISHIWFQSQFGEVRRQIEESGIEGRFGLRVVTGPHPRRGGTTPDPYIGLTSASNPKFAVAAGCRNNDSPYGSRPYAYVGVRSYPEFGGSGQFQIRGTLQDGVKWSARYEQYFLEKVRNRSLWYGADFQWPIWRPISPGSESIEYMNSLVDGVIELATELGESHLW